jgi:tryptophanyl-tRNA synthetase
MSKSAADPKGLVNIMDDNSVILKKIKSAVTDTDGIIKFDREAKPGVSNLLGIHSAISGRPVESLEEQFAGEGYGALKAEVADVVIAAIEPIRERTQELMSDQNELDRLLADGADRANELAEATLSKVYEAIGFLKAKE